MEQPATPTVVPGKDKENNNKAKKKIPTPQELISHYQTQGLDSQQASIKVIEDLQNVVMRVVSSNSKSKKDNKFLIDTSRKIDSVNSRLAVVDMKLDSKPGYLETLAIGIASGAALNGIGSVLPHVFEGFAQIWSSVRTATKPSSP
ncbi:Ribosomal protein-related, putative [Theobroma cacao]|uniref:Ribosomal protein-related, putative n=1 Tax=Theobroma cacao TaxID=3641 RepID=A0A061GA35_THECC|nr:Ribosomal protein-related, putative [Theobroma cacao]